MSPSGRLSGRVVNPAANDLMAAGASAVSGADDGSTSVLVHRQGRRQLERIRTSLSQRDQAVLADLRSLHYLTSGQIERLHFASHASDLASARACRRVLSRLHDLGLVSRLDRRIGGVRAGSAAFVFRLTPLGHRLLGNSGRGRSREPSLAHLQHVLEVAEVVVALNEHNRGSEFVEKVSVQGEPDCWRWFVAAHGGQGILKPDLRLTIEASTNVLHWFVELDRGSEHLPVIQRKLRTYLAAWRDGQETARAGVFPRVLWIVPDQRRADALRRVIADMVESPVGLFEVCVSDAAVAVLSQAGGQR